MLLDVVLGLAVWLPALGWIAGLWAVFMLVRRVPVLADASEVPSPERCPSVDAIVPARDEGERIEAALTSLATQSYEGLRVIAVDDRSTDDTGAAMERVARAHDRVQCLRLDELPAGWLGKVHAMDRGVARSDAEWLLFTDADVRYAPDALARAVFYADHHGLDLLSGFPEIEPAGFVGDTAFDAIGSALGAVARLWLTADPESDVAGAAGAFILVRRAAWDRTPGLEYLRLEVGDDFAIAQMVKDAGGRCALVNARGMIRIRWYASFAEMRRRTQKNFFAIIGRFQPMRLRLLALVLLWLGWAPWLGLGPWSPTWVRVGAVAGCAAGWLGTIVYARWGARRLLPALFPFVGLTALAIVALGAAAEGARIGGIRWRDRTYPSSELRDAQRVRI